MAAGVALAAEADARVVEVIACKVNGDAASTVLLGGSAASMLRGHPVKGPVAEKAVAVSTLPLS